MKKVLNIIWKDTILRFSSKSELLFFLIQVIPELARLRRDQRPEKFYGHSLRLGDWPF